MLEFNRMDTDIKELILILKIDINKTNSSKKFVICHYWYFKDIELYLCNGCHNLMQKAAKFNDVAIVSVKGSYYRSHFWYISKNDAINIMKNSNLGEKNRYKIYKIFLLYVKISKTTYYKKNTEKQY